MIARGSPATPEFVRELHHTLRHLYDPAELRRTPLIELLGVDNSVDPIAAVQRILLQAIEALKPQSSVPPHANAWRIYHILNQRYAGQFDSSDIATNLAISGRQLRRLQTLATESLGDYLWARYGLGRGISDPDRTSPAESKGAGVPGLSIPTREQELDWLQISNATEAVDVVEAVGAALAIARPLIATAKVRVETDLPAYLPPVATNATAFRHALLSVLSAATHEADGGILEIAASARESHVWIEVRRTGQQGPDATAQATQRSENLEIALQLVTISGGSLNIIADPAAHLLFTICLSLPVAERALVLVVEDNADALRLFERYLVGSRYVFVGTQDPQQAVRIATEVNPCAIVLDLMLPGVDGWEILGRLREHPKTQSIPILVCTILPHEDLALALGAAALIRKPVNRQDFLAALDRQPRPIPSIPNRPVPY